MQNVHKTPIWSTAAYVQNKAGMFNLTGFFDTVHSTGSFTFWEFWSSDWGYSGQLRPVQPETVATFEAAIALGLQNTPMQMHGSYGYGAGCECGLAGFLVV